MPVPVSVATNIAWPAIPSASSATYLAILHQLEESQWWDVKTVEHHQMRQLSLLLAHAYDTVPFYRERLKHLQAQNFELANHADLRSIPPLTREDLQGNHEALTSRSIPKDHGPISKAASSGSTGHPVKFLHTKVTKVFAKSFALRNSYWHGIDSMDVTASLQITDSENDPDSLDSTVNLRGIYPSGSSYSYSCMNPVGDQLSWLEKVNPQKLVTYPSNLAALAREAIANKVTLPNLKYVSTLGEVLPAEVRALCREAWAVPVVDIYSCRESNVLALQCPDHDHYHIQSERVIVEILNEDNVACQPGEIGRVVITDLHNYALPLIRYELGDHAEVGEACSCGRTLPVLKQIWGRTRNMLILPNGGNVWPRLKLTAMARLAPVKQLQILQHARKDLEVKVAMSADIDPTQKEAFEHGATEIFQKMSAEFDVRFTYVNSIPRGANGKFEDFVSAIRATP